MDRDCLNIAITRLNEAVKEWPIAVLFRQVSQEKTIPSWLSNLINLHVTSNHANLITFVTANLWLAKKSIEAELINWPKDRLKMEIDRFEEYNVRLIGKGKTNVNCYQLVTRIFTCSKQSWVDSLKSKSTASCVQPLGKETRLYLLGTSFLRKRQNQGPFQSHCTSRDVNRLLLDFVTSLFDGSSIVPSRGGPYKGSLTQRVLVTFTWSTILQSLIKQMPLRRITHLQHTISLSYYVNCFTNLWIGHKPIFGLEA